jgi:hypothetical protein
VPLATGHELRLAERGLHDAEGVGRIGLRRLGRRGLPAVLRLRHREHGALRRRGHLLQLLDAGRERGVLVVALRERGLVRGVPIGEQRVEPLRERVVDALRERVVGRSGRRLRGLGVLRLDGRADGGDRERRDRLRARRPSPPRRAR